VANLAKSISYAKKKGNYFSQTEEKSGFLRPFHPFIGKISGRTNQKGEASVVVYTLNAKPMKKDFSFIRGSLLLLCWIGCLCPGSLPASASPTPSTLFPLDISWWQRFNDLTLDSLITVALRENQSVTKAMHQRELARINWHNQRSKQLPSLALNGGWSRSRSSGMITKDGSASLDGYWSANATISWEADLFGALRARAKEQKENFYATQEELYSTKVALAAQVANDYFLLRQYQQELLVVERNCASQKKVMELTEVRYETGLASKLDVVQARSVYYNSRSTIPSLEANIQSSINAIAVLIGAFPDEVRAQLALPQPLSDYIEPVGIRVPAELLRRRPDVQAAEYTVAAEAAALGASKSEFLPTLSLTGTLGYEAHRFDDLGRRKGMVWQMAPVLTWTLFNGGENVRAVQAAKVQWQEAIDAYRSTLLTAVQEVESALSSYAHALKQTLLIKEVVIQGKEALTLSLELYKQGLTTFQNVLDAQRSLLTYEDSLVQAQAAALRALVQLYQALGGGYAQV
jgi:NodT family efflux transporter outer membrane factor (OMF) lipoprotein